MRLSGKIDISLIYQFYISEFPNIPKTSERVIKDAVGVPYLKEISPVISEGYPFNYIFETETVERELIGYPQFAQLFSIYFQSRPNDIIEHIDKRMGVSKIEDEFGKLIYMN